MKRILYNFAFFIWMISFASLSTAVSAPITGRAGAIEAGDLYWISFGGDHNGDSYFLMQIDSTGTVTMTPRAVIPCGRINACVKAGATSLSKNGPAKLNYWVYGNDILYRVLLSKTTFKIVGVKKFNLVTNDDDGLQITQRGGDNFILVEQPPHDLTAYNVTPAGLGSTKWDVVPNAPDSNDEGSLASDGGAATTNRNVPDVRNPPPDRLYYQTLNSNGKPQGNPVLLATSQDIEASDVSNILGGGNRFIAYVIDTNNSINLQVVDASGAKVGAPIKIRGSVRRDVDDQTIAIDPRGRFVVFTATGSAYGCPGHDVLLYQAINPNGHKVGPVKVLARCDAVEDDILNIDILNE